MRDILLKRLQEIETAIQNCISQHNACQGAKQEVLTLLQEMSKLENEEINKQDEV